jgi:hypothetical protein
VDALDPEVLPFPVRRHIPVPGAHPASRARIRKHVFDCTVNKTSNGLEDLAELSHDVFSSTYLNRTSQQRDRALAEDVEGLPDDQVLAYAAAEGRALVTANNKDFMPLDSRYRAAGQAHPGLIVVSTKTFPQDRGFTTAITAAFDALLSGTDKVQPGQVLFLTGG